jgi:uncharacterized protein (DUF58 family)
MSRPHLASPEERAALADLELLARTTVEGVRQGLHRSPFHGYSAEFAQYRHYRPGDDLRHVDWKRFARSDRLYTRQFRETTNLGAVLVLDQSRSMAFPPVGPTKFAVARAAAAALAGLIVDQGDAVGLLALGDGRATWIPPGSGRHHLHTVLAALARLVPEGRTPIGAAVRRASGLLRRKGLLVVLSDFYDAPASLDDVRRAARAGHEAMLVHVLAPQECRLEVPRDAEVEDLETGERLVISAPAVREAFAREVDAWARAVRDGARAEGLDTLRLVTDAPVADQLRRFLVARRAGA